MPYQNNNNRITSDAVVNNKLNPTITPQDSLIKYKPELDSVNSINSNIDMLAQIGNGINKIDNAFQKTAKEQAIDAYEQTEGAENKKEWAKVSRNLQGMAKFNPYIKDEHKKLIAQDILKSAIIKMNSDPNLHKRSQAEYTTFMNDIKSDALQAFKDCGLQPVHYGACIEKLNEAMQNQNVKYTIENNDYNYKRGLLAQTFNTSVVLTEQITPDMDEATKVNTAKKIFEDKAKYLIETGVPDEDIASTLVNGLQEYITNNPQELSVADITALVKDLKIGDKPVQELIPQFSDKITKFARDIRKAAFEDMCFEHEEKAYFEKIHKQEAAKELGKLLCDNPNITRNELLQQTQEIAKKYGVEGYFGDLIGDAAKTENTLNSLRETKSNPDVLRQMWTDLLSGDLGYEDIIKAMGIDKTISVNDARNLIASQEKMELKEDKKAAKVQQDYQKGVVLSIKNNLKILKDRDDADEENSPYQKMKQVSDWTNEKYAEFLKDKITRDELLIHLQDAEKHCQKIMADTQVINRKCNPLELIMGKYRNQIARNITSVDNAKEAHDAFIAMNMFSNSNFTVNSTLNPSRTLNGETRPHSGTDIIFKGNGSLNNECPQIYSPKSGKVLAAGNENTLGNYILIQFDDGTCMVSLHMSYDMAKLQGTRVNRGTYIGRVGNTGRSKGNHLHCEFYKPTSNWWKPMTPKEFANFKK